MRNGRSIFCVGRGCLARCGLALAVVLALLAAGFFCTAYCMGVSAGHLAQVVSGEIAKRFSRHTVEERAAAIAAAKPRIAELARTAGGRLDILVFKHERRVEVRAPGWRAPLSYPMTASSGTLGPKLREGDRQIPEGVYGIGYLHPNSAYHLALKVSYPNADDLARAAADGRDKLGGNIMIHGKAASVGCVAVGDDAIEDFFLLAATVGKDNVRVVAAPYDLRAGRRPELEASPLPWYPGRLREIEAALQDAPAALPGVYVWQRDVSPAVLDAARAAVAEGRELFALAGEFDRAPDGSLRELTPPDAPPWDFGGGAPAGVIGAPPATAVFRVRIGALDEPATAASALAARTAALGATRLQLDVDAPERRLSDYASLAAAVRTNLPPGATLSLTLLPCHLAHPDAVRAVLASADYGVLQLHGIDPPRALDTPWQLMDPATVRTALDRARALGLPFRVALPAYAYVLQFAPDGAFRRLWAEGFPGVEALPPGDTIRLAAPDLPLLASLLADPDTPPVLWFRLPVPGGDRWCLDAEPLPAGNGFRLYAAFLHHIPLDPATVPLRWRDTSLAGEWIPLGGCTADAPPGRLPAAVTLAPHACGERFLAAVVLTENRLENAEPIPQK